MVAARKNRDQPWLMRTYAGHSSATESNALYRRIEGSERFAADVAHVEPAQQERPVHLADDRFDAFHPGQLRPRLAVEIGRAHV